MEFEIILVAFYLSWHSSHRAGVLCNRILITKTQPNASNKNVSTFFISITPYCLNMCLYKWENSLITFSKTFQPHMLISKLNKVIIVMAIIIVIVVIIIIPAYHGGGTYI